MAFGHMNLKRIFHRSWEELVATYEIAKVTSLKDAITTFRAKVDIQIMNRNGYKETPVIKKRLIKKHEIMLKYFEKQFHEFYETYDYNRPLSVDDSDMHDRIWICWWQGEENAPEVVKRCIESIKRSAGGHTVTVITEDNYREYVHIPEWVIDKHKAGIISRTNLSDLLRLSLLAEHGGMWVDTTFFCSVNTNLDRYFEYPLWSIKRPDYLHCSVASGYFAGYSLYCNYEWRFIFATIRDFFLHYWEQKDRLIDYLLVDYMIVLAQRYDQRIADAFQEIIPNNPKCDELFKILGDVFDPIVWESLQEETDLFKLSWKHAFPLKIKGMDTFYSKLLNGELGCC